MKENNHSIESKELGNENSDYVIPDEGACSPEFPTAVYYVMSLKTYESIKSVQQHLWDIAKNHPSILGE